MFRWIFLLLIMMFVFVPSYSQSYLENSSNIEKNVLVNILNEQSNLSKEITKNKVMQEDLRVDFDSFVMDTKQSIKNLEDSARLEFVSTILITIISVFISAFAGYSIHKREYNAELAKIHFADIKSTLLPQLNLFYEQLKGWNYLGKKIQTASLAEICNSRSLDMFVITEHKKSVSCLGKLDIELFNDLIQNHYSELKKSIEIIYKIHDQYNRKLLDLEIEIKKHLLKLIPTNYRIVNSSDVIPDNEKIGYGYPTNSLLIDAFTSRLVVGTLRGIQIELYSIHPRLDNNVLDLNISNDINEGRDIIYKTLNFENDKKIIFEIIKKINESFRSELINQLKIDYKEFQSKIEILSLIIKKLQLKTILKTSKSCDYVKDHL